MPGNTLVNLCSAKSRVQFMSTSVLLEFSESVAGLASARGSGAERSRANRADQADASRSSNSFCGLPFVSRTTGDRLRRAMRALCGEGAWKVNGRTPDYFRTISGPASHAFSAIYARRCAMIEKIRTMSRLSRSKGLVHELGRRVRTDLDCGDQRWSSLPRQ